jgi:hypothetical protein
MFNAVSRERLREIISENSPHLKRMQTLFMTAQVKHLYNSKMENGASSRSLKAFHRDALLHQYLQHLFCMTFSRKYNLSLRTEQHNAKLQVI